MKPNSHTPVTDLNEMYPDQVRTLNKIMPKVVLASVARQLEKELNQLKQQWRVVSALTEAFKDAATAKAYNKASCEYHSKKRKQLGL